MKQNYFMFREWDESTFMITNELGFHYFLGNQDFHSFVRQEFDCLSPDTQKDLSLKGFLYDSSNAVFIERASGMYRQSKQYLFYGTCLHIFVLTNMCNLNCVYCQAQDMNSAKKGRMTTDTAEKAVEIALQSHARNLNFEFQGGEPLLNFPVIKHIIEYTEEHKNDKEILFSLVSNTLLLTEEMIEFFKTHNVAISTSLDGNQYVHDTNRPSHYTGGTYKRVVENIQFLQDRGISVGAIQTTTKTSLKKAEEIVKAYIDADLDTLFIRPLTPLGYAKEHWDNIGYRPEQFIEFYKESLKYILISNRNGHFIREGHAVLFLRKILKQDPSNYMELRSPCGAGIGQIAYYYDGNIYTCDEGRMLGEMGLDYFRMGSVDNTYQELMDSQVCKVTCQASVLEALPSCCDCVYHPYCGVCPVVNMALEDNIYARQINDYRCKIYKGILDTLFSYIRNDNEACRIFETWI